MQLCDSRGISNVQKLSEFLEYKSPEKLYRLERDQTAKPSFAILLDIANKFENVNMNWLITGDGEMEVQEDGQQGISRVRLLEIIELIEDHEKEFMQLRQFRRLIERLATKEYIDKVMDEIKEIKKQISHINPARPGNNL